MGSIGDQDNRSGGASGSCATHEAPNEVNSSTSEHSDIWHPDDDHDHSLDGSESSTLIYALSELSIEQDVLDDKVEHAYSIESKRERFVVFDPNASESDSSSASGKVLGGQGGGDVCYDSHTVNTSTKPDFKLDDVGQTPRLPNVLDESSHCMNRQQKVKARVTDWMQKCDAEFESHVHNFKSPDLDDPYAGCYDYNTPSKEFIGFVGGNATPRVGYGQVDAMVKAMERYKSAHDGAFLMQTHGKLYASLHESITHVDNRKRNAILKIQDEEIKAKYSKLDDADDGLFADALQML